MPELQPNSTSPKLVPWYCNTKACGGRKIVEAFPGAQVWCNKGHKCSKTRKV